MPRLPLESWAPFLWGIEGQTPRAAMAGACSYSVILTDQSLLDTFGAPQLEIEAGQDGLEEGVLDQTNHDVHEADVRVIDPPFHRGLRRDLFAGAILEELRDAADDPLVHLADDRLVLLLLRIVDLRMFVATRSRSRRRSGL